MGPLNGGGGGSPLLHVGFKKCPLSLFLQFPCHFQDTGTLISPVGFREISMSCQ